MQLGCMPQSKCHLLKAPQRRRVHVPVSTSNFKPKGEDEQLSCRPKQHKRHLLTAQQICMREHCRAVHIPAGIVMLKNTRGSYDCAACRKRLNTTSFKRCIAGACMCLYAR
jgi:hypothetical protein